MSGGLRVPKTRPVKPEMPSFADLVDSSADIATTFTQRTSIVPPWLEVAFEEIGTYEIVGVEDNPRIIEYLETVKGGLPKDTTLHDEIAWCAASHNWCYKQVGIKGTNKPNARSWLKFGIRLTEPRFGCTVVLKRGKEAWMGHVGFFLDQHSGFVRLLGGNQKNRFGINNYKIADVLDYRWPKGY